MQKNLDESTHPIGSTRSMQVMMQLLSAIDGMTYVKAPTWDGQSVPQWYVSITSSFDTRVGPLYGSDSHIV